ncbi:pentapeptide repeat-containing protein [Bacillus velezensis]|uniref:pentapeptide repeat-containing protein n=1 Tax=Bacillus velezensis TaxID=492670 RepID=UPI0035C03EB3
MGRGADLIEADLRKINLKEENLRGAYLIAADLRGADLSKSYSLLKPRLTLKEIVVRITFVT